MLVSRIQVDERRSARGHRSRSAVSERRRCDGYSWFCATNEPLATPSKLSPGCDVTGVDRRAVHDLEVPRQRGSRQRTVLRVGRRAREGDGVADTPGEVRSRPCDDGHRRRVARGDRPSRCWRPSGSETRTETVRVAVGAVRVRRVRRRGVAEGAVAVEVPRVRQRVAVGVGRTTRVEVHGERPAPFVGLALSTRPAGGCPGSSECAGSSRPPGRRRRGRHPDRTRDRPGCTRRSCRLRTPRPSSGRVPRWRSSTSPRCSGANSRRRRARRCTSTGSCHRSRDRTRRR